MPLCINPRCQALEISEGESHCSNCNSRLLLDGAYKVLRFLGEGGFARTFEVKDLEDTKVLKVLKNKSTKDKSAKALELFKREAKILTELNIRGIPKGYDYFVHSLAHENDSDLHCLVMEKINGDNLQKWMEERENKPITTKRALDWLFQLVNILKEVHLNNFFHRDIKLSNIMLSPGGELVLIDFGTARAITETLDESQKNQLVTRMYSEGYAPLEQILGEASPRSDFFALGRTFIHLLTGKHPQEIGDHYRDPNTDDDWDWIGENPDCPNGLVEIINSLCARSKNKRPKDCQEIIQKLEDLRKELYPSRAQLRKIHNITNFFAKNTSEKYSGLKFEKVFIDLISSHSDSVNSIAISQDGRFLVSGGRDKKVKIWNTQEYTLQKILAVHSRSVSSVAISPALDLMASADIGGQIKLWSLNDEFQCKALTTSSGTNTIVFSSGGKALVAGSSDGVVRVWDTNSLDYFDYPTVSASINSLSISSDEQYCVYGTSSSQILVLPHKILEENSGAVTALAITSNNEFLISGSGRSYADYQEDCHGKITIWDLENERIMKEIYAHDGPISAIAVIPSSNYFFTSSYEDSEIKLWDCNSGDEKYTINAHTRFGVRSLAISPDGCKLYSAGEDYFIKSWQII